MSNEIVTDGVGERWARLRFAVVGALLVSPPRRGELRPALEALASRSWSHPTTGEAMRFGYSTLEAVGTTRRARGAIPSRRWRVAYASTPERVAR